MRWNCARRMTACWCSAPTGLAKSPAWAATCTPVPILAACRIRADPATAPIPVIEDMDVVYMLRVQLERMEGAAIPSRREYNRLYGLDMNRVNRMKEGAIICHPGPMNRGMEINADVADCARSRILDQVNAGVLTRMAEMYLLLGGENNGVSA